ncbi:MAG: hypothetical protein ABW128_16855 [Rhizorhabdus sp.]
MSKKKQPKFGEGFSRELAEVLNLVFMHGRAAQSVEEASRAFDTLGQQTQGKINAFVERYTIPDKKDMN